MTSTQPVTVVLPTYNEAGTVRDAISGVRYSLSDRDPEVIVVDDDSPDRTVARVREVYGDSDRVRCIRRTDESGLASAVLRGIDEASHDTVAVMDADLQHPPRALPRLVLPVEVGYADIAVGSRRAPGGDVAADWPLWRRFVSHGATALSWAAVPRSRQVSDPMSGFFAVRRDVVQAVRDDLNPCGYKILLELLARCPVENVHETGYEFLPREKGESNLGPREYVRYVRHLGRLLVPARRSPPTPAPEPVEVGD